MKKTWRILCAAILCLALLSPTLLAVAETTETPIVYGISTLSQKFSPVFYETAYDGLVVDMTQLAVLTTDRMGGIVKNAIEGETIPYNGVDYLYKGPANVDVIYDKDSDTTKYTIQLREDIKFSDGEPLTADDIIFTYYVLCDPSYVGLNTFNTYPILGLTNYRTQTSDDVYAKYNDVYDAIIAAGAEHAWASTDTWTQEQQDWVWTTIKASWTTKVQMIVDYVVGAYADQAEAQIGVAGDKLEGNDGAKVALGMAMWGFAKRGDDGVLTSAVTGKTWTLADADFPTIEDYYNETVAAYGGDPVAFWETEKAPGDSADIAGTTRATFISDLGSKDESMVGGVPNIAGIVKTGPYSVEITTQGFSAPAVYSLLGNPVIPKHYYGDPAMYDYDNNKFGFPFGDVSMVESKTSQPMGAGPYKFIKYDNKVAYFEANENYFLGKPVTKYFQFKETISSEVASGTATGTIDFGELSGNKANFALIAGYNSNGESTGDVITSISVDNRGYGYIGMNAKSMLVGEDPYSKESTYLRKAFATVLAVYRDVAYDSYYGDAASVVNYPISNTSWAAPQPTDEGYKVAFSVDVDGKDIYTSTMTQDEKYAAALEAAKGYLKAAGFTFDDATGMFTAAPEGAKLSYELIIPGDGEGDHPSFMVVTGASNALKAIGIDLHINDPKDSNVLWDALNANTHEMWCAAWQTSIDPDMHQIYFSTNVVGANGTDSNHYNIAMPELDNLILEARTSDDQAFRKAIYKQALELIVDQAVEIPAYQRQNPTIYSTERVNIGTVTPAMTTFWGWLHDLEMLALNAAK